MFRLVASDCSARAGKLKTAHGVLNTPLFMPVATKGSVKLVSNEELAAIGTECFISNALVLSFRPGLEVIGKAGGLHKFAGWRKGIFTDSGGFQVLSTEFLVSISDIGARFRSPFDGSVHLFTPERAIAIQNSLGSDVAMCLDDVPHYGSSLKRLKSSRERTFLWAGRCKQAHKNKSQKLFGITQGGINKKLREQSTGEILGLGFDGVALGGLCIGEEKKKMHEIARMSREIIPKEIPVYLMGVGSAKELLEAIALGIDVFDSCFPTRTARHGMAITSKGNIKIDKAENAADFAPLDKECRCYVCRNHTKAFLHHLFRTKEENGMKYLSYHNLFFIQSLMKGAGEAIKKGKFAKFRKKFK